MSLSEPRGPGAYIDEPSVSPPPIVGVPTAIPGFIGYTQKARISGKPAFNEAIRINSLADYEEIFGADHKSKYTLTQVTDDGEIAANGYDFKVFNKAQSKFDHYNLTRADNPRFNLYNSMRLFYANGGATCYVVSVGDYAQGEGLIDLQALKKGLDVIAEEVGPTMLVVPEAVLLPSSGGDEKPWVSADFASLVTAMIEQAEKLQDRVAIVDVYGTRDATQANLEQIVTQFRSAIVVGPQILSYGISYFPFLETTVVPIGELDYQNVENLDVLQSILKLESENQFADRASSQKAVDAAIDRLTHEEDAAEVQKLNQDLTTSLPLLLEIEGIMASKSNVLPPSGAMAGVYTLNDATKGVCNAPADVGVASVKRVTFGINHAQQAVLNVPLDGKAVNAIRAYPGRGPIVWGARTLDGTRSDLRYIKVRRTLIYIEQSTRSALEPFVFLPNNANTWVSVIAMVSSFLLDLWSQGGLIGETASEAFEVECGLGSTMTALDILEGYMVVQITLQMVRPGECTELVIRQKMEGA